MNKYRIIFFLVFIFGCSSIAVPQDKFSLKVLQLNVWMHGSNIKNGVDAVAGIILQADADLVTLSEVNPGFMDSLTAYRKIYPNPEANPGFTWPSDNTSVSIDRLVWAPEADSRDRIDFIFYSGKQKNLALNSITIVGPQASVIQDKRIPEKTNDPILVPKGDWPSDHKGLLATFELE